MDSVLSNRKQYVEIDESKSDMFITYWNTSRIYTRSYVVYN